MALLDGVAHRESSGGPQEGRSDATRRPRGKRRVVLVLIGSALLLVLALAAWRTLRAARAGQAGKTALLGAEHALSARSLPATRQDLALAKADFARVRSELHGLGPLLPVMRVVPFVRVQVRGIEAIADAGSLLAEAGDGLSTAAARVLEPTNPNLATSAALGDLRVISASLKAGLGPLDAAIARIDSLNSVRLIGPLARARKDLVTRLPGIRTRVVSAQQGLDALIAFAGGDGPRRYLVLTQNPDEVRPGGGFIGTYGVLTTQEGHLTLESFASISSWYLPRPQADVPAEQAPTAFKLFDPPRPQTIANVNTSPDWPESARLAVTLWQRGGGEPVDGVVSLVPAFLARVLTVLGPVTVPDYNEKVSASNLVERTNFYTHGEGAVDAAGDRKRFVGALAQVVVQRLLDAPTSSWSALGAAVGHGFDAREALAWATDPKVSATLQQRGWDGALPVVTGDFLNDAEFEFSAKNGTGLHRTFDHVVVLRADGSARLDTTLTIANTESTQPDNNVDSLSYITLYGPQGGTLADGGDTPYAIEPTIADHPAAGWVRSATPGDETTLAAAWQAPGIALRQRDGSWEYRIRWMYLPGHTGDVLHLRVELPAGWHWAGPPPPATVKLDQDFTGTWAIKAG